MRNIFFIYIWTFLTFFFVLFNDASAVKAAITIPDFPSCINPQGSIKSSYSNGVHGIPGNSTNYQGKDTVYKLNNNNLIQCFCSFPSQGIQTNWWKISGFSSDEIENFKAQGWIFVPDGRSWGLDPSAYLAKNINYICLSVGGGIGGGEILGLATTGNIVIIYGLFGFGLLSLILGVVLKRVSS